jgi:aldehyde dehydrogenase (NAD+)
MSLDQQGAVIDGTPVTTASSVPIYDPSTGQIFAETPDCGPEEVDRAVQTSARAARTWRRLAVAERALVLRRLGVALLREIDSLGELEARQTGKPLGQARRDVEISARYFDFYASAIESFGGTTVPLNDDTVIYTGWEPHGVTGHIVPWNYPLSILSRSVAPSLAMGNGCVLKPAEEAPLTAIKLVELAESAGLPTGLVNVVTGYGETAGAALTAHPGIGHISFTGSVEVGKIIGRAAADRVVPVTMELGGKSPNIVFGDADLDRAIPIIANSILQMAGQTCSAGARLLVAESVHQEVVRRLVEIFESTTIGPALDDPALGPLVSAEQRARVLGYIQLAEESGAAIRTGGEALSGGVYGDGYFVRPTIIDDVDPSDRLAQEEIFGPVLVVTPFRGIDEAIELANNTEYGLVAGVWTTNLGTAHRMAQRIESGQVFVNTYGASGGVELPFGGVKHSGYGREKGVEGLRGFGQLKTTVIGL